jgi:hypothetical protein
MVTEHENGLCGKSGIGKAEHGMTAYPLLGNRKGRTRNDSLPLTALITSKDILEGP